MSAILDCKFRPFCNHTKMPALARRRADTVCSIGPMLAKHSGPALARNWFAQRRGMAQCRHYVVCRNDAVMCPVYIKQYWLYSGKTASAQYRPITLQHRPDAGPMLYAQSARCWQSIGPVTVCMAARHWPNAGITL